MRYEIVAAFFFRYFIDSTQIAESSGTLLEFSKHFGVKAHQTQRSGPLPGSIPTLENIEDLLQKSQKIQDALTRIKEVVITQNVAFAEQQKDPNPPMTNGYGAEPNGYQPPDETKAGGFAGPDPKKRRGRAAPPGRCHSCNRAETPEWRRGPDGARTLCNACGLRKCIFYRCATSKLTIYRLRQVDSQGWPEKRHWKLEFAAEGPWISRNCIAIRYMCENAFPAKRHLSPHLLGYSLEFVNNHSLLQSKLSRRNRWAVNYTSRAPIYLGAMASWCIPFLLADIFWLCHLSSLPAISIFFFCLLSKFGFPLYA